MRSVGIDLGTTNTVAASQGTVLRRSAGLDESPVLPSVVAFPPSGATLVGITAKNRRAIDPTNTLFSTKRLMGQRWLSHAATRFRRSYPFDLVETDAGSCAFRTRAGLFSPTDIASKVIAKVFATQQALLKEARAVITVPTAFEREAREATQRAAERAGLSAVSIVEEPVATAVAYTTLSSERERMAAVYDLGGGTFDLAIIDCQARPARVVCHAGDAYLGGDDIDRAVAEWVAQRILERHNWDLRSSPEVFDRLLVQCELAKIRLGTADATTIELGQVDPAAPAGADRIAIDRETLESLADEYVRRTFLLCDEVLRTAGLDVSRIDAVYLAGGASLLPVVRETVGQYFATLPRCDFDPMEVVAVGASLMAG